MKEKRRRIGRSPYGVTNSPVAWLKIVFAVRATEQPH